MLQQEAEHLAHAKYRADSEAGLDRRRVAVPDLAKSRRARRHCDTAAIDEARSPGLTVPDRRWEPQGAGTGSSDARPGPISSLNGEPLPSPTATHGALLTQATERRVWS
jgi:hypothetical protein